MKPISLLRAFFAVAIPATAWAQASLPTGANVVAGSATISATANSMTVATGSQRTIIDYTGFNVGAGNTVRFNQPASSSATLNRVISTEGSSILGSVSSNGQIFLVNPNGIFVGAGGSFSGSSIYLSTGNISNADFLASNIRFDPPPPGSTIRFEGRIDATDVISTNSDIADFRDGTSLNGGTLVHIENSEAFITGTGAFHMTSNSIGGGSIYLGSINPPAPALVPQQGGTLVISGTGSSGSVALTGGTGTSPGTSFGGTTILSGAGSGGIPATITAIPTIAGRPTSSVVISGSATFPSTPPVLTVTNSNGSTINWQTFSVSGNQVSNFAQTSASSSVLNRVLGNPVQISGTLTSNGKVWLVDSTGNLVSPSRVVSSDGLKLSSVSIQTPNLSAAPSARSVVPSIPRGTSNLVDGTVTVRLSLVDAAPISLR